MVNAVFTIEEGVAIVELQRPERLNAIDFETKQEITEQIHTFDDNQDVRVVLFRGTGDAFCAGGDITEIPETDYSLSQFTESWAELFDAMLALGKPTVAAVDGVCLGGGFDLMLHCDFVVAAEDATIGQPEISLGIVNHFSPPLLREMVGWRKALELVMTGKPISGAEAERIGLVTQSAPEEEFNEAVDALVDSLRNKSPRVLRRMKGGLYETMDMSPTAAQEHLGRIAHEAVREDPDYREGIDAQLEDREPEWRE